MKKNLMWLSLILVLAVALGGCSLLDPLQAQGTTNLDSVALTGSLNVDGAATLSGALSVDGNLAHPDATNAGTIYVCEGTHGHASAETAVTICIIPADANIIDFTYEIVTDWDDSTTATVDCGISGGTTDLYVDGVDLNASGDGQLLRADDAATVDEVGLADVGASNVTIVCQVAEGTNDAAAGEAFLRILYYVD